ncbi:PssE/Cps14G family polysaccharide biosynthesis glycosyltransferase [Vibrio chagasii]|uniref:Glycosyl transferase family 28 C-terminal domain-containing protein n=1 Tax=Vibrio chagasii TaxID=170679 RepID=A0A7Y4DU25_9VIBR|nr:PssE/Cps14G family polysaccharide biosynthesis glycosyltransferase [Vibrio chagasii]NOH36355.1 hypothetical protein [Vibrio chagasii]
MRFLYTVGTTPFNSLTNLIINLYGGKENDIFMQTACCIGTGSIKSIDFSSDFRSILDSYDIVVTHAGAGSIYSLLEQGKRLVVVPNTDRDDQHQVEIAKYVEDNNFALVCWNLDELENCLDKVKSHSFERYTKDEFFMYDEINRVIDESK